MKKIKNLLKNVWSTYCEAMYLAYEPYYMRLEKK